MKKLDFTLGLLLASLGSSLAQVTVEVVLDQNQFLASEPLVATVRVTNRSGQTVRLGAEPDWLTLSVEAREGFIVSQIGELPVTGESLLESSKVVPIRVNLARCFNLTKAGRYSVTASVRIKQWDREFSSRPKAFDIVRGSKLWEQDFGVPPSSDTNAANPEVRKYALQQANYLKELRLYARLTDATESRVFRVFPVGSMVSFSRPEAQVDGQSNLHVLFQSGARAFTYCVISPNGEIVLRQRHDYNNTRPRLQVGADGKLGVVGGARRITADDLPAPASITAPNDVETPKR